MSILRLNLDRVEDEEMRNNLRQLQDAFNDMHMYLAGFKHFEIELSGAVTDYAFPHQLGYQPKDLIQTFQTDGVTVTWKYDDFDENHIVLTTDGAATIRGFVGRKEG